MDEIVLLIKLQTLGFCMFLFQAQLLWAEPFNNTESSTWKLWAKPRICVLPSDHLLCEMETDLIWLGEKEDNICLFSSLNNAILHCWSNAEKGEITQSFKSDKPISYWLTLKGNNKILVKTSIRIIQFPQRKIRRRRRHVWSLL